VVLFQTTVEGKISNLYLLKLTNKTHHDLPVELKLENVPGTLSVLGGQTVVPAEKQFESSVLVQLDPAQLPAGNRPLVVGVYSNGRKIETLKTMFVGPRK